MPFVLRRLVLTVVTLLLVTALCFWAFTVIPGDPASFIAGTEGTSAQIAAIRAELGLDDPLGVRYVRWLKDFVTGNLGNSVRFRGAAIRDLVAERIPVTLTLALMALVGIIVLTGLAALVLPLRPGSPSDRLIRLGTASLISLPSFFVGILGIWIFGIGLRLFRPGAYVSYQEDFAGFIGSLVFPALAIALPNAAVVTRFLRESLMAQFEEPYVRAALSKGASWGMVLRRHIFKNALIPAVTLLGMIIAEIFSGSIVIEQVFTIPGIGRLLIAAITARDYPLAQTLVGGIVVVVVLGNTLTDLVIQWIDPRIRVGSP